MKTLTNNQINECFKASHQQEIMVNLYKIAIPEWDNIKKLTGWPSINDATWKYICKLFIEFDHKNHPDCLAGGCWMNSGFSIDNTLQDNEILPIDPVKIIYKNQRNRVTLITISNMRIYDGMISIHFNRLMENSHTYYRPTKSSYKRVARLLNSPLMQHTPRPSFKGLWTAI
jgi:hypothetical protein